MNIHEAKTHFSKLIARVKSGEEIIIAVAELVPIQPTPRARRPGSAAGRVRMAPDFDAPLPDNLVDAFEHR